MTSRYPFAHLAQPLLSVVFAASPTQREILGAEVDMADEDVLVPVLP